MNDRLHEMMGQIAILHGELLKEDKIKDAKLVFEYIKDYDRDIQGHYLNLLLQYYFQQNDLNNLKELLLVGAKFEMNFLDVKDAFLNIKSNEENVIEFMEENVVFIKDNPTHIEQSLSLIYEYYQENEELQVYLEETIDIIKNNRYICAFCYKHPEFNFSEFFLNEDLLESLNRDLPYLLR